MIVVAVLVVDVVVVVVALVKGLARVMVAIKKRRAY